MILDKVKKYFKDKKNEVELHHKAEGLHNLFQSFSIEELQGDTYIMCNGIAVRRIDPKITCKQAMDMLRECRDAAREHYQAKYK